MKLSIAAAVLALLLCVIPEQASGTDRFFRDFSEESPSKLFRFEAKSPDNRDKTKRTAFQSSFTYTFTDLGTQKVLWTSLQGERSSPVTAFVSDAGWTVIRTDWDELIAIDRAGKEHGTLSFHEEVFSPKEKKTYIRETTAGPIWSGYSLWYFLDVEQTPYFVVRTWWGRRIFQNLQTGKHAPETEPLSRAALESERKQVMTELTKAVEARMAGKKEECCEGIFPVLTACHLAGTLKIQEAVPNLEVLQDSPFVGSSGGVFDETVEGTVNPFERSEFTLRTVAQLSLRRLGKVPLPLPLTEFDVEFNDSKKNHPFRPSVPPGPRADQVEKLTAGLKPEQVMNLIGAPDLVDMPHWEYDIDANPPFTLIVSFEARKVSKIERKSPAFWKDGLTRDAQIAN